MIVRGQQLPNFLDPQSTVILVRTDMRLCSSLVPSPANASCRNSLDSEKIAFKPSKCPALEDPVLGDSSGLMDLLQLGKRGAPLDPLVKVGQFFILGNVTQRIYLIAVLVVEALDLTVRGSSQPTIVVERTTGRSAHYAAILGPREHQRTLVPIYRHPPHDSLLDQLALLDWDAGESTDTLCGWVVLDVHLRAIYEGLCRVWNWQSLKFLASLPGLTHFMEILETLAPLDTMIQMCHLLAFCDVLRGVDLEALPHIGALDGNVPFAFQWRVVEDSRATSCGPGSIAILVLPSEDDITLVAIDWYSPNDSFLDEVTFFQILRSECSIATVRVTLRFDSRAVHQSREVG